MILLLWGVVLGFQGPWVLDGTLIVDHLETPTHDLFLDDFEYLVTVRKKDGQVKKMLVKGQGPGELTVPLSLVATPTGPVLSGLYYALDIQLEPTLVFRKRKLEAYGPIVFDDGDQRMFGTAVNYWDKGGTGFSGVLVENGQTMPLLPFSNPVGKRHLRAFAAIAYDGENTLFCEPLTMQVHLIPPKGGSLPLPVPLPCLRTYNGQQPETYSNPMDFVNSWDRPAANSAWLIKGQTRWYAVLSFDAADCSSSGNVTVVWELAPDPLRLAGHKVHSWDNGRLLDVTMDENQMLRFLVAVEQQDGIFIIQK